MSEDRKKGRDRGDFLSGKGFYVILFVCVAVIGISAWILLFTGNTGVKEVSGAAEIEMNAGSSQEVLSGQPEYSGSEDVFSSQTPQSIKPPEVKQEQKTEPSPSPSQAAPEQTAKPETGAESKTENKTESKAENKAENNAENKQTTIEEMTFVWPVSGKIEKPFSVDMPVYNRTLAVWRVHTGIDIAAAIGTKVAAVADGKVVDIYEDDMMGTTVVIDHGNKLLSKYSNLAQTPVAKVGDNVAMGAVIGAVGNTALGEIGEVAHLHLEMSLDGDAVDPENYLPSN